MAGADMESLIARGFALTAHWELDAESGFQLNRDLPTKPGIIAFAVDGEVCYIGAAKEGIATRMRVFENITNNPNKWRYPYQQFIRTALEKGSEVTVLTIFDFKPKIWKGLPIKSIVESLNIEFQPKWAARYRQ